jgi:NAD+ synthase (glutamine-hydrolysing)
MIVAIAQLNLTVGAFEPNFVKIEEMVKRAKDNLADLIVFSELTTTGYPPRDLLGKPDFIEQNNVLVKRIASLSTDKLGILFGHVENTLALSGKKLRNAVSLAHDEHVISTVYKSLLPTYDVFDEDRYFEPADKQEVHTMRFKGMKLGVSICEDMWNDQHIWTDRLYRRDPIQELVNAGAEILINLSGSPFIVGKPNLRRKLVEHAASKYKLPVVYVNQVGGNDELIFDGGSMVANPHVFAQAAFFEEDFMCCEIQRENPPNPHAIQIPLPIHSVHDALIIGIRDYVQKCGFQKVVIGLSGGIDSAVTAVLAVQALGKENVVGIAMPSKYSSPESISDAQGLANNLGIKLEVIPIGTIYNAFTEGLKTVFQDRAFDVTEENLQARTRGVILMAYSNKFGHLVLTTGNKSEIAVGYCTLYGDMCGGIAAISDVPKMMVYKLANFINGVETPGGPGKHEVIPFNTIRKPPSAELRPDQKDQDSLPPYEVLDDIIEQYVEHDHPVERIALKPELLAMLSENDRNFPKVLIARVCRMIDRSEYKRRQAAPGLKVTSKAFGLGRRFPVAHGYR